jgi:hypothetical protein
MLDAVGLEAWLPETYVETNAYQFFEQWVVKFLKAVVLQCLRVDFTFHKRWEGFVSWEEYHIKERGKEQIQPNISTHIHTQTII